MAIKRKIPLNKFRKSVEKAAEAGLKNCAVQVLERLYTHTELADHTLLQLADLGHPYAEEGKPRIPGFHEPALPGEPWGTPVHTQSGTLLDSIRMVKVDKSTYAIGADPKKVVSKSGEKYLDKVILGDSLMVGRNFPLLTIMELEEEKVLHSTFEEAVNEGVKNG